MVTITAAKGSPARCGFEVEAVLVVGDISGDRDIRDIDFSRHLKRHEGSTAGQVDGFIGLGFQSETVVGDAIAVETIVVHLQVQVGDGGGKGGTDKPEKHINY